MQRILIVSDTHKRLGNLYEALEKEGSVDAMIHLGDLEGDEGDDTGTGLYGARQ